MKAQILKVGTVDADGKIEGWGFYGGIFVETWTDGRPPLFGGYTIEELRAIAEEPLEPLYVCP